MYCLTQSCSKTEGVDYLSDCQYIGGVNPGPSSYKADVSVPF